ncbi:MAG: hypothetical protein KatS3mg115_0755 [Candidatus Poribacteria bacterium]|nr:MAG: hypothetical protein KatS3mg115_0755 [Candidatus Poribacteria bacterium]
MSVWQWTERATRWIAGPAFPVVPGNRLQALVASYEPLSLRERWWLTTRALGTAYLMELADRLLPEQGTILDLGCGPGLLIRWLAQRPGRFLIGVELSSVRVQLAKRGALPSNACFFSADLREYRYAGPPLVGVLLIDVLLYLEPGEIVLLLRRLRAAAAPEAVLFVKDSLDRPRWKAHWMRAEERVKRCFRFYGVPVVPRTLLSAERWAELFRRSGWRLRWFRSIGRWSPYPGWIGWADTGQNGRDANIDCP